MSELLAAALRHAERSRPVFPCDPETKAPLVEHGFKDATSDPAIIHAWFDRLEPPMLAIPTGARTGLVVLDSDGDDGAESLRKLEREHAPLPRTASAVTPRGGGHTYFAHPGGEVPNSVGTLGPGLDIRGDGGYVIVPPSLAASGRRYEVDEEAPAAPLPAWLCELVRRPSVRNGVSVPVSEWLRIVRGLPEGERNAGLARLVGHLLNRDVDARLVAELAHLVAARFRPPLEAAEVDRVVASIAGREVRRRAGARP